MAKPQQNITTTSAPGLKQRLAERKVIGIAVGVTIFVLALIGMSVFLMRSYNLSRRSQTTKASSNRFGRRRRRRNVGRVPSVEPQRQSAVLEDDGAVQFVDLDRDLPQPISEGDLRHDWEKLSVSIKNHVTHCYHRDKADQRYHVEKSSPLAYLEPYQLEDPKSRDLAIRQCIAKFIVANIEPEGNSDETFLPPKLVSIIRSMPIMADENSPLLEAALARWRVITNFLLYPERDKVSTEYMINSDIIKRAAEKLSNDLQPYLQPIHKVSEEEYKASLEKTLRLGANFGLKLFSQGARWSFGGWDVRERNEKNGRRSLVVLPALLKMTDEYGHFLRDPLVLHAETCVDF